LRARCVSQKVWVEPNITEAMAALYAVQFCEEVGFYFYFFAVIFEGDTQEVSHIFPELVIL